MNEARERPMNNISSFPVFGSSFGAVVPKTGDGVGVAVWLQIQFSDSLQELILHLPEEQIMPVFPLLLHCESVVQVLLQE